MPPVCITVQGGVWVAAGWGGGCNRCGSTQGSQLPQHTLHVEIIRDSQEAVTAFRQVSH